MSSDKAPAFWKSLTSGGVAGIAIVSTGHPFDTIKVRLQTQVIEAGKPPMYAGMMDCIRKTVRNEGALGLYKGMASPLIGYTPMWALCFFGYDFGKRIQGKTVNQMNLAEIGLAGGVSAFFTTLVMGPAERVKTLLQVQQNSVAKLYDGPVDVVKKLGVRGVFQGTLATLYRDVPASAAYFGAYEATKRALAKDGQVSNGALLFAGGMAGVMNWTVCMPLDVVKSRIQTAAAGSPEANFSYVFKSLLAKEGPAALYRGFGPVMVRAFPCNAIGFFVFDKTMNFLNTTFP